MTPARRDPRGIGDPLCSLGRERSIWVCTCLALGHHTRLRPVVEVLPREGGWACWPRKASAAQAGPAAPELPLPDERTAPERLGGDFRFLIK